MKKLLALLLVLVVLAAVLFWTAPAEIAYRFAANRLGIVRLDGVSGSIWNGGAREISARGQALGTLHWEVDRFAALSRRVQGDIVLNGKDTSGRATIAGQGRDYAVSNLQGRFPATVLGPALDIPALVFGGTVALDFPELALHDGVITTARGAASWTDLTVAGVTAAATPGLRAEFTTNGGQIVGTLADLGGPIALSGTIVLEGTHYRTEVAINSREPNPQIDEVLKFIGEHGPNGGSVLRVEGELRRLY